MGPFIAALAYSWASHGLAFVLMPWSVPLGLRLRTITLWAFAALLLYFLQDWFVVLLLIAVTTVLLSPIDPVHRAAFFLVAAPALPSYLVAPLPFPGLNYLLELTQYKMAAIVLLLPLLVMRRYGALRRPGFSVLDGALLFYIVYTALVVAVYVNLTMGLRHFVDLMVTFMLPFLVLRYAVKQIDDIETFFKAFLVVSIFLAAIALVSTAKQWDFYTLVQPTTVFSVPDFRAGFVRIQAVANTHSLAYHLAAALLLLEYLKGPMNIRWVHLMVLRFAFVAGAFFTNSHGAYVGFFVAWVAYRLFLIRSNALRTVLIVYLTMGAVLAGMWLLYGSTDKVDTYGTFSYRQELFRIGFNYVLQVPLFGDYDFYRNPVFQPLRQGQGIIDITNLYLQILLHYGFLGGVPFFAVMVAPIFALLSMVYRLNAKGSENAIAPKLAAGRQLGIVQPHERPRRTVTKPEDEAVARWRRMAAVLVGVQVGWLIYIATTSHVALTVHIGLVFAAFGCALADLGPVSVAAKPAENVAKPSQVAGGSRLGGLQPT
jgi:O-antigen ligase